MYSFTVKEKKLITPNTLLLTLKPKRGEDTFRFYAGQYAAIGFKGHGRPSPVRCFSIVSSPNHPEEVQFGMRVIGRFTSRLANLKPGAAIFVRGPFGNFVTNDAYDRNVVLLAGGIGITPFISMIRYAAETSSSVPITLLYSCKSQDDIPFYQELLELERENSRFRTYFFVTNGTTEKLHEARARLGHIDDNRLSQLTGDQFNRFSYFICGPKGFTHATQSILVSHNTEASRIVTEEFTPATKLTATLAPRESVSRWTYGLSAASLALGTAFFMVLDLYRAVPRLVNVTATASVSQSATLPVQSSNAGNASSATTNSPSNAPAVMSQTPNTVAQPSEPAYQPPVTSVS